MNKVNMADLIREEKFHSVGFMYNGIEYGFSGWWLLDWDTDDKFYDSKEEFLADKIFNGKTLSEIEPEVTEVDFYFEPGYDGPGYQDNI